MEWNDLKFGQTLRESGKFSHVVERIVETRLGPQAPDDRESALQATVFVRVRRADPLLCFHFQLG